MATIDTETAGTELALAFEPPGLEQIPGSTILTRLNYYDGKFLRADDLRLEQDYVRRLVELDARAGGSGLVYGFDVKAESGDTLTIGGGLAFDGTGRVLYMPAAFTVELQKLIAATRNSLEGKQASAGSSSFAICPPNAEDTKPPAPSGAEFYVLTIAHAEDACGEEDVFGKLCDDGCATSTDRAFLVEGVIVRARPFLPRTPFVSWAKANESHIRSQLVSAFFADEKDVVPCQISKAGLDSGIWCNGAAAPTGWEVPIAVVGRLTSRTFVDEWVVRRERIETPPRRYWQGRMCMRPWDVFLAQVLQFQCQLPSVLDGHEGDATETDPCAPHTAVIQKAWTLVNRLENAPGLEVRTSDTVTTTTTDETSVAAASAEAPLSILAVDEFRRDLLQLLKTASLPSRQILLDGGLVELPPAGYLPVTPGTTPSVDEQVRRLLGPGVDLRFCVASADYVPGAFESAQHMDRISLVAGLEDAARKPKVDIIVPDGALRAAPTKPARGWDTTLTVDTELQSRLVFADAVVVHGAGRTALTADGGAEFGFAGLEEDDGEVPESPAALYGAITCKQDPFALAVDETVEVTAQAALCEEQLRSGAAGNVSVMFGEEVTASGTFRVLRHETGVENVLVVLQGLLNGSVSTNENIDNIFQSVQTTLTIDLSPDGVVVLVTLQYHGATWRGKVALKEAPQVFSPQSPLRLEAMAALKALGGVLGAHPYTDTIPAKLFDPGAGTTGGGGITATRDWVLFHRRRVEECTTVTPTPTPTPVQTEIHDVRFVPEGFPALLKNLSGGNLAGALKMSKHVGDAEFDLGTANLETAKATLLAEWKAVTGSTPAAAAIAGESVAGATLKAQAGVVAEACGAAVSVRVFPGLTMPSGYSAVTFIEGEVVETDVRVFGVKNSAATKAVLDRFTDDDGRSLTKLLGDLKAELVDLDVLTFEAGGTDLPHTAALKAFDEVGLPVDVVATFLIGPRGDEVLSGAQLNLLIQRLGGSQGGSEFAIGVDDDPWPVTEHQVALFLVGEAVDTVGYRVLALQESDKSPAIIKRLRGDRDVGKFVSQQLDPPLVDLGRASFVSNTPGPVDGSALTSLEKATPPLPTLVVQSLVVSRLGAAAQPIDGQLTELVKALGATEQANSRVKPFDAKDGTWPFDDANSLAILVVSPKVQ